ncbi:hypothetical protein PR003_g26928 [Phytophthora rubi]|uniref:Uncharacterized protein n=1 Tax=Phytophthora rubi TaxID=129364 RepID=A0A6A4CBN1_9STRA|nr:hypothetical protein PR002_g26314 [Phytophthora rubi]KAE8976218.1 hypothetical protein PR001_g25481 [Phytophthora rubi]KAE9284150.1 hypothetical protein PR003_g26928 [Phytophthora rubi]
MVVTSRKPQRQRRWRQTEMTGFAMLRQPLDGEKLCQWVSRRAGEQGDSTEIVVKPEPAADVGSEPTATAHNTGTVEQVAALKPRWVCFDVVGGRNSRPQCQSSWKWRLRDTSRRGQGGGTGIGLAAT